MIPRSVIKLDHANSAFYQPPHHQTASSEFASAVPVARGLALFADIEHVGSFGLHPERDLHRLNGRFELRSSSDLLDLHLIQPEQQIDLTALLFEVKLRIRQRLNLLPRIGL